RSEPQVEGSGAPERPGPDRGVVTGPLVRVQDEPGAVEGVGALGAVAPGIADLPLGDLDDLLALGGDRRGGCRRRGGQAEEDGAREGEGDDERSCAQVRRAQWCSFLPDRRVGERGGRLAPTGHARRRTGWGTGWSVGVPTRGSLAGAQGSAGEPCVGAR